MSGSNSPIDVESEFLQHFQNKDPRIQEVDTNQKNKPSTKKKKVPLAMPREEGDRNKNYFMGFAPMTQEKTTPISEFIKITAFLDHDNVTLCEPKDLDTGIIRDFHSKQKTTAFTLRFHSLKNLSFTLSVQKLEKKRDPTSTQKWVDENAPIIHLVKHTVDGLKIHCKETAPDKVYCRKNTEVGLLFIFLTNWTKTPCRWKLDIQTEDGNVHSFLHYAIFHVGIASSYRQKKKTPVEDNFMKEMDLMFSDTKIIPKKLTPIHPIHEIPVSQPAVDFVVVEGKNAFNVISHFIKLYPLETKDWTISMANIQNNK